MLQVTLVPYILSLAAFSSLSLIWIIWKINFWVSSTETGAWVGPERGKKRKKAATQDTALFTLFQQTFQELCILKEDMENETEAQGPWESGQEKAHKTGIHLQQRL